jgi:hypothetical protein
MPVWLNICKCNTAHKQKDKNHTIISIDAEKKSFCQNSTYFIIKTLNKLEVEGTYFILRPYVTSP